MNKKTKQYLFYFLLMISLVLLSGCSSNSNEEELLKAKLASEIQYLDTCIFNMLNKANGIQFENYQISSEKIEQKSENKESSSQSEGGSSGSGQSESSGGEEEKSSSGDSSSSKQEDESKENDYQYKMVENSILMKEKTPEWESLTIEVEKIYSDWAIITIDLYQRNVDKQKILSFNTDLDNLTKAIKEKNKEQTLTLLAKLYSYIPIYYAGFSDDQMQINLYKIKSSVFNAYAIIEQENKDEVKKQLQQAEEAIIAMMNNMSSKNEKEYNMNKSYILLKDLQNTIDKNDSSIFYLKYKNLVEELNIL